MKKIQTLNGSRWSLGGLMGALFGLMLILNCLTPYLADDFRYMYSFKDYQPIRSLGDLIASMQEHSLCINGRLVSHTLEQIFLTMPKMVFNLCNAAVFTGTVWLMYRLCNLGRKRNALLFAICFGLLWLFTPAFGQVMLWQVGALNYLWAVTFCLVFIAPYVLRFLRGRELITRRWQQALFCAAAFFFGWYSEITSFVGICMAIALLVLGRICKKDSLKTWRLLPVVFAICGFIVMFRMPAQMANKSSDSMTLEVLQQNLKICNNMLETHAQTLIGIWMVVFVLAFLARVPWDRLLISALFAVAGICANYMPIVASYYPERCMITTFAMLTMAVAFVAGSLMELDGKREKIVCAGALSVLGVAVLVSGLQGCYDIYRCYNLNEAREEMIAQSVEAGQLDVVVSYIIPQDDHTPGYDLWRLDTANPDAFPNQAMGIYYGVNSLLGE